jgi:AcrR family transcriptional regulator
MLPGASDDKPKWSRRKEARPGEIVDAALEVFAEKGFAATNLDDIAHRAGDRKGPYLPIAPG